MALRRCYRLLGFCSRKWAILEASSNSALTPARRLTGSIHLMCKKGFVRGVLGSWGPPGTSHISGGYRPLSRVHTDKAKLPGPRSGKSCGALSGLAWQYGSARTLDFRASPSIWCTESWTLFAQSSSCLVRATALGRVSDVGRESRYQGPDHLGIRTRSAARGTCSFGTCSVSRPDVCISFARPRSSDNC